MSSIHDSSKRAEIMSSFGADYNFNSTKSAIEKFFESSSTATTEGSKLLSRNYNNNNISSNSYSNTIKNEINEKKSIVIKETNIESVEKVKEISNNNPTALISAFVICICSYSKKSDVELSLTESEILFIWEVSADGAWLHGCRASDTGIYGWFPAAFVSWQPLIRGKILFDYKSEDENSLTVFADEDVLFLPSSSDSSSVAEWKFIYQLSSSKKGWVPYNYICTLDDLNRMKDSFIGGDSPFPCVEEIEDSPADLATKQARKKWDAVSEFISTEHKYVKALKVVTEIYEPAIIKYFNESEINSLFVPIGKMLISHSSFKKKLDVYDFNNNNNSSKRDLYFNLANEIIEFMSTSLGIYIDYCGNQVESIAMVSSKRKHYVDFDRVLNKCQCSPESRSLDLNSYLLEPMQRITRYPLLLKQIIHYSDKSIDSDYPILLNALNSAEGFLVKANEAARHKTSQLKIKEICSLIDTSTLNEKLDLSEKTKFMGPRVYIHESALFKCKTNRKLYGILFNDLLLLTKPNTREKTVVGATKIEIYRKPLPLNEIKVREPSENSSFKTDPLAFEILHAENVLALKAITPAEKRKWISSIEESIQKCILQEKGISLKKSGPISTLGTLSISILEAKGLYSTVDNGSCFPYVVVQLNDQILKSKICKNTVNPKWNQQLMASVQSLDEEIKFTVFSYSHYSENDYLGHYCLSLDFLEYYGDKSTEIIKLKLNTPADRRTPSYLHIRLTYKTI